MTRTSVNRSRNAAHGVHKAFGVVASLLAFSLVNAQSVQEPEEPVSIDELVEETDSIDEVVVTGSRIKRDTYSSVAPLQIISGQVSREVGVIDPTSILQDSSAAAGAQIDVTYQGFVLDNGPGSSTVDLRGLGASRTLVLINGRRAAPAGVEGAPFAPDLNVIPSALVQRYEVLLDGASSVYGSDALSGVANIILRKDFDGLELESFSRVPQYDNGIEHTISAAWGHNGDRGFVGIAGEYFTADAVTRNDRPWSSGCETYREIDTVGNVRTENIEFAYLYGMKTTPCVTSFGARRTFENNGLFGSIYWTDDGTNTGIPNLSEATLFEVTLDLDNDGVPDVDFTDYFIASEDGATHLLPERESAALMAYGEYTLPGYANLTPYFEASFTRRETNAVSLGATVFEEVPANNPFNPCNPNGLSGVDCGEAYNNVLNNPNYIEDFGNFYGDLCAQFGFTVPECTPSLFGLLLPGTGALGALPIDAQVSVAGDRDNVRSEIDQIRVVAGIRGDIPALSFGSIDNWSFDAALVHTDSSGDSIRRGINGDRLTYSLTTSMIDPSSGNVVCGADNNGDGIPDGADCVPVNMLHPNLYGSLLGNDFGSQAERDYLFTERTFETVYKQSLASLILNGELFELPAGTVQAAIGYDYRNDKIRSIPNDVAREGLLYAFFKDLGAIGEKDTEEWFLEIEAPLLVDVPAFKELTVNVSTRHTDDEFYGGAWTYSGKLAWRPVDSLLLRGTVGTSYRAPNLRENFLRGTSGFRNLADPCVVPENAIGLDPVNGGVIYDASLDDRTDTVLENCRLAGTDPETLGIISSSATSEIYSVEVLAGVGSNQLSEEKSESWTAGISWEQPFFRSFDLSLGATYYEIEIRDEIIELFSQTSINRCYTDPNNDSPFCANIQREDLGGGSFGLINLVDEAFLNRDALKTRGVDLNMAIDFPTEIFGRAVDLSADFNFNRKLEFVDVFNSVDGSLVSVDSDLAQFGFPEWEGQGIFRADIGDFRLTWSTRYISSVRIDPDIRADYPFGNVDSQGYNTCLGAANGDLDCRPVGEADNYFRHDFSLYYYGDTWTVGAGARNVLNEYPPQVDGRVQFSGWNVPFGSGYDINGRQYFLNVSAQFGGS